MTRSTAVWRCGGQHETVDRLSPRSRAIYAAVYPRPEAVDCLDLFGCPAREPHLFEWNLFNCRQTRTFAFDMDGVICHDWPGGDENGAKYLRLPAKCQATLATAASRHSVDCDGPFGKVPPADA